MFLALKEKLFGGRNGASKNLARSRLSFVLVQDRTGLTSDEMTSFKSEMIGVIEKYFVIDKSGFDIAYKRDVETTTLLINSPVVVRRRNDKAPRMSVKPGGKDKKEKAAKQDVAPAVNEKSVDEKPDEIEIKAAAEEEVTPAIPETASSETDSDTVREAVAETAAEETPSDDAPAEDKPEIPHAAP